MSTCDAHPFATDSGLTCDRTDPHASGHSYTATSQPDTKHADTASLEDA